MKNSFIPLYVTNFFGTLNDNFLKTLAGFTVIGWIADERVKSLAMGVTAGALVLPYILCSPLADRLTAVNPCTYATGFRHPFRERHWHAQ